MPTAWLILMNSRLSAVKSVSKYLALDGGSTYAWCSGGQIGNPPGQSPWGYQQVLGKSQTSWMKIES
jgi:hypothetical protein